MKRFCPLCRREIPKNKSSKHHLVPRSLGGKNGRNVVMLHPICHKQIHALFTRNDLKYRYNTIKKIRNTKRIRKFLKWVLTKPPEFDKNIKESKRYKKKGKKR